jgi:hypothetical protein
LLNIVEKFQMKRKEVDIDTAKMCSEGGSGGGDEDDDDDDEAA